MIGWNRREFGTRTVSGKKGEGLRTILEGETSFATKKEKTSPTASEEKWETSGKKRKKKKKKKKIRKKNNCCEGEEKTYWTLQARGVEGPLLEVDEKKGGAPWG